MRFSVFIALVAVALAFVGTGAAGPQPTAAANNSTAPIVEDVDPANASAEDIGRVVSWLQEDGADRSEREVRRARDWLDNASSGGLDVEYHGLNGSTPTAASTATPRSRSSPSTATATPTPADPDPDGANTTRIDGNTEIVATEYLPEDGVARITIHSSRAQAVTFSDAGRFVEGGAIPVRSEAFTAGETATVEIPVTEKDGRVGVAITTKQTPLYAAIIQKPSGGLDILRALSPLQAWGAGILVAFAWMVIAGFSVLRNEDGTPEVAR